MKLTKTQENLIINIAKNDMVPFQLRAELKKEFKPLFKPEKGWYKLDTSGNKKWMCYFDGEGFNYGVDASGKWIVFGTKDYPLGQKPDGMDYLASEEEVKEGLGWINESIKAKEYWYSYWVKADVQHAMGDNKGAITSAENAIKFMHCFFSKICGMIACD